MIETVELLGMFYSFGVACGICVFVWRTSKVVEMCVNVCFLWGAACRNYSLKVFRILLFYMMEWR
jgi:hypothetical protein